MWLEFLLQIPFVHILRSCECLVRLGICKVITKPLLRSSCFTGLGYLLDDILSKFFGLWDIGAHWNSFAGLPCGFFGDRPAFRLLLLIILTRDILFLFHSLRTILVPIHTVKLVC